MSKDLREVAALFLRLGFTAFGGPAAHIGLIHAETVRKRRWLSDQEFLDLLGATNLIPGPNSTEMAIHIGFRRAGWRGLVAGGACFIVPAMVMVIVLAWAFTRFNAAPQLDWLLYVVKPVVIAIIAQALWALGRRVATGPLVGAVGVGVLVLSLVGLDPIALLAAGGLVVMIGLNIRRLRPQMMGVLAVPIAGAGLVPHLATPRGLSLMFLTFLKIGAVLYGSGYVLLAFLRSDFVVRLGWLTDQQLMNAVTVGQVTPGPLFTAATFIGYILGGLKGALLATLGIFLPSFIFVAITSPQIPRMRRSPWLGALLDGVNASSLGLMAAVTWRLGRASLIDIPTAVVCVVALVMLVRFKVNPTWLIIAGVAAGLLRAALS